MMLKITDVGYLKNIFKILDAKADNKDFILIDFDSVSFRWIGADLTVKYMLGDYVVAVEDFFCLPADFTFKLNSNGKLRVYYEN